ncbi:MAG: ATPase, T2SS/T4P/T4SS family [Promethearchaeota archaeon]
MIKKRINFNRVKIQLYDASILIFKSAITIITQFYNAIKNLKLNSNLQIKNNSCEDFRKCNEEYRHTYFKNFNITNAFNNPIKYYNNLLFELAFLNGKNKECKLCMGNFIADFNRIKKKFEQTTLIREYLKYVKINKNSMVTLFYEDFFEFKIEPVSAINTIIPIKKVKLIDQYCVGPYVIEIFNSQDNTQPLYSYKPIFKFKKINELVKLFKIYLQNQKDSPFEMTKFYEIDQVLNIRKKQADSFIKLKITDTAFNIEEISEYLSHRITAFEKLMPYLLDDNIEEIYADNPFSYIYLDHREYGRCLTDQILEQSDFSRIVTYLRAISGFRLDSKKPSLKTDIISKKFHVRFTVDIPPLAMDEFHLDIRKLRKKYFTLTELIANQTLTSKAAAYLYFCLIRRRNIVVIGNPGDGKTTLVNALDILTPPNWRKITIEDVTESIPQNRFKHQTRFQVAPFESQDFSRTKPIEIIKLLHRSPDYLLISELQSKEDSNALFHAISAGLKGIYTCHGNSVEDILVRWNVHHKIPIISFPQLDNIIHVKKIEYNGKFIRKLVRISEIQGEINSFLTENSKIDIIDVFRWNAEKNVLELKHELYNTPVLNKIKEFEPIKKEDFEKELTCYQTIFELLVKSKCFGYSQVIEFFNELYNRRILMLKNTGTVDWDELILWSESKL